MNKPKLECKTIARCVEFEANSAQELLTALSPFGGALQRGCLFRGHSNVDWALTPKAFRTEINSNGPPGSDWTVGDQLNKEIWLLRAFADACEDQGIPIPGGRDLVSRVLAMSKRQNNILNPWPQQELLPIMTLAQHHGIPTRLLDWTQNPYVACYFAAEGSHLRAERGHEILMQGDPESPDLRAYHRDGLPTDLAVWMYIPAAVVDARYQGPWCSQGIAAQTPSYAENPNLRAQRGVMMFVRQSESKQDKFLPIAFDLQASRALDSCNMTTRPVFAKFKLPWEEAGNLLVALREMGVSASTLFPGYYGAARQALLDTSIEMVKSYALFEMSGNVNPEWLRNVKDTLSNTVFHPLPRSNLA